MIPYGRPPTRHEYEQVYSFLKSVAAPLNDWLHGQGTDITAQDIVRCVICNDRPKNTANDKPLDALLMRLSPYLLDDPATLFDPPKAARCLRLAVACLSMIADGETPEANDAEETLDRINAMADS